MWREKISITQFEPDSMVYIGLVGLLLGVLFLLFFFYRRILRMFGILSRKKTTSPKFLASLRNLILIFLWTAVFGMVLFAGFFFRAFQTFNHEEPVAEVIIHPHVEPDTNQVTLVQFIPDATEVRRQFLIKGDQWMLEGDILKWNNWLNFLGLHTRYRLTRLRGRYIQAEDEKNESRTIYPLVENEDHPLWRYLYLYGYQLPFISTVYGNAAFQTSEKDTRFQVYVSTSGLVVRKNNED